MRVILIANPKGGSGKTTLSINIAGYLASCGHRVAILDLDKQKSATQWLTIRPFELPIIDLFQNSEDLTSADWLVIDSPAGLHDKNLGRALKMAHNVIVPIAPSRFDIQASREFLRILDQEKSIRKDQVSVGLVGMRMSPKTLAASLLEQFIEGMELPVLAYLRETQVYVNAAFEGKTLFDLPHSLAQRELEQWEYLLGWLEKIHC